jgi:hypothetical protein
MPIKVLKEMIPISLMYKLTQIMWYGEYAHVNKYAYSYLLLFSVGREFSLIAANAFKLLFKHLVTAV